MFVDCCTAPILSIRIFIFNFSSFLQKTHKCKSCRSRQELSNEYLLAKIGVDTAENEPLKVWRKIQFIIHSPPYSRHEDLCRRRRALLGLRKARREALRVRAGGIRPPGGGRFLAKFGKISAKCCSFSAVSAPIFARQYAVCSIFQNTPDSQAEIFEISQKFANFATFAIFLLKFHENCCLFKPIFC